MLNGCILLKTMKNYYATLNIQNRYTRQLCLREIKKQDQAFRACERDVQCGPGSCCAVSLWLRGLRMCTPRGQEGDKCHPFSHKVPFPGKRQHHTCPCMPHLSCSRSADASFQCTSHFKHLEFQ
ncbi:prokineticin-1 isoform X2 [Narcine bancroftii]|uniref:prokineticin-1 isoform X2 n=1 Tax=Narcine bancroftii TaxID=1343680 RepID=UPI003831AD27